MDIPSITRSTSQVLRKTFVSAEDRHKATQVFLCYKDFWDCLKFRRGFDEPHFSFSSVRHLLIRAATIVTLIRNRLDETRQGSFLLRLLGGISKDFLFGVDYDPSQHQERFLKELVRATLKDGAGYVEGLDEATVDAWGDEFGAELGPLEDSEELADAGDLVARIQVTTREFLETMSKVKVEEGIEGELVRVLEGLGQIQAIAEALLHPSPPAKSPVEEITPDHPVETPSPTVAEVPEPAPDNDSSQVPSVPDAAPPQDEEKSQEEAATDAEVNSGDIPADDAQISPEPAEESADNQEGVLEVKKVASKVSDVASSIVNLADSIRHLDPEVLSHPHEAVKIVDSLHKQSVKSNEELMQYLLALDSISCSSNIRPLRREQALKIQSLISDVDAIDQKLRDLKASLDKDLQKEKEEREKIENKNATVKKDQEALEAKKALAQALAQVAPVETKVDAKAEHEKSVELAGKWRRMKFSPRFEIQERPSSYVVAACIPGMKKADFDLGCEKNVLTLSGSKIPTAEEIDVMRFRLRQLQTLGLLQTRSDIDLDEALLLHGSGQFGSFVQQFRIPNNVDGDEISAKYDERTGILEINLPKKRHIPIEFAIGGRSHPLALSRNFFTDTDLFW